MDEMKDKPQKQKLEVDVLGRGKEKVTVDTATTIKELRDVLNLDKDIQALDNQGRKLSDSSTVGDKSKVNFVPNVEGGC